MCVRVCDQTIARHLPLPSATMQPPLLPSTLTTTTTTTTTSSSSPCVLACGAPRLAGSSSVVKRSLLASRLPISRTTRSGCLQAGARDDEG